MFQKLPRRRIGIRLPRHDPLRVVEGVSVSLVIVRDEVHEQHVLLQRVHAEQPDLKGREHPPVVNDQVMGRP